MRRNKANFSRKITSFVGSTYSLILHTIFFIGIFALRFFGFSSSDVLFDNDAERSTYIQRELVAIPHLSAMETVAEHKKAFIKNTNETNSLMNYNMPDYWTLNQNQWTLVTLFSTEYWRMP